MPKPPRRFPGIKKGPRAECNIHGSTHMLSMGRGRRICAACNPMMHVMFDNRENRRRVLH